MSMRSEKTLVPRNGHTLEVFIVCRISGCGTQTELSLDDQEDNGKGLVADNYTGPAEYCVISTTGKGERLDRPELEQIESAFRSQQFDLVIFDDLSRLIRGGEAAKLLGVAVDNGTRVICINDGIDTADPTWEEDALTACSENVAHNERTSRRIKQKCMNRFKKFGGAPGRPIVGVIVPPGAKTYGDWQRDDSLTSIIQEGARRLRDSRNCSAVADWLNSIGFKVGPYCRRKSWNGGMVRHFYSNPLLKGVARRGTKQTVKNHESGRRVPQKNPEGPTFFEVPHLAHLDATEFDTLNAVLNEANAKLGHPTDDRTHPRQNVSRKRSRFPGRRARCWYCGHEYAWGANGIPGHLMCKNSRDRQCWNAVGFDGELAATKIATAISTALFELDGFESQFAAMLAAAPDRLDGRAGRWAALLESEESLRKQGDNLMDAIAQRGPDPLLLERLNKLGDQREKLALERRQLEWQNRQRLVLPESPSALRGMIEQKFCDLARNSYEFADLMRSLVPEFCVYLVRLCDGGHLLPRAKVRLNLAGKFPDVNLLPGLHELVTRELTLDLFLPPARELIRPEVVRLASEGVMQRDMQRVLSGNPTLAVIRDAILLQDSMRSQGLEDPYVTVFEPPDDYTKLRRHKHSQYVFKALDGYERPAL